MGSLLEEMLRFFANRATSLLALVSSVPVGLLLVRRLLVRWRAKNRVTARRNANVGQSSFEREDAAPAYYPPIELREDDLGSFEVLAKETDGPRSSLPSVAIGETDSDRIRLTLNQSAIPKDDSFEESDGPPLIERDGGRTFRVGFATNRALVNAASAADGFSGTRSSTVTYGNCDVFIPKSHRIGSIGSSAIRRFITRVDDRLKIERVSTLKAHQFWRSLNSRIAHSPGKHAVIFLHGYNVSFNDAAIRAAQIGADLGIEAMAMFSWPSAGKVEGYPVDESSIEASTGAITNFLIAFASNTEAEEVHLIAHSMGNRGILRAMERIGADASHRANIRFSQVILAAPDVDADSFREIAAVYGQVAKRTTLYISERDRAVGLSAWLHGYPRVGFYPPVSVFEGIDTVSVSGIDISALGHGYVGEAREVLTDMHQLIFSGLPPERRFSLRATSTLEGLPYWLVKS